MADVFDTLFGGTGRPVRRQIDVRLTVDEDGNPIQAIEHGKTVTMPPKGGIDSGNITVDRFFACGCPALGPAGGQCAESGCRRLSCSKCAGRCKACNKPLCLEHSRSLQRSDNCADRLCIACFGIAIRRRRTIACLKALARPFVSFDEGKQQ